MALPRDDEYALVYQGICAVAAHCDGALSDDGVGFNGQDTHFGRRIASVPFDQWTDDVKVEAARIALTYKVQIESYTGIQVGDLDVVREARELGTNHAARNDARTYEKRQQGLAYVTERKAVKLADGRLALSWNRKDPDCFGALLEAVKALPGRRWTGQVNEVDFTPEAVDFIEKFALSVDFDLDTAKVDAEAAVVAQAERYRVTLVPNKKNRVSIDAGGYEPNRVADARNLPGRVFKGATKTDEVDLHPAVLSFARKWDLKVDPAVVAALDFAQAQKLDNETKETMLLFASRQANPENLPPAFVALVQGARKR